MMRIPYIFFLLSLLSCSKNEKRLYEQNRSFEKKLIDEEGKELVILTTEANDKNSNHLKRVLEVKDWEGYLCYTQKKSNDDLTDKLFLGRLEGNHKHNIRVGSYLFEKFGDDITTFPSELRSYVLEMSFKEFDSLLIEKQFTDGFLESISYYDLQVDSLVTRFDSNYVSNDQLKCIYDFLRWDGVVPR